MMMRYTKVTPQGDYIPPPPANSKASYATMLFVRADIVKNSGGVLSKAVTIATRYAAVRRQTAPGAGKQGALCRDDNPIVPNVFHRLRLSAAV
jgi:acyl-CoA oxidase